LYVTQVRLYSKGTCVFIMEASALV